MKQSDQILFGLERVAKAHGEVELLNGYKGLPIVTKSSVVRLGDGTATLNVQKRQATCLELEGHTYILCAELEEAASATVIELDKAAGKVDLANFLYAGRKIGERMILRVEPKDPIPVTIRIEGQTISGNLIDISIDGAGIHLSTPAADQLLKRQSAAQVSFQLLNTRLEFSGTVAYVKAVHDANRLGVDFSEDPHLKAAINQYISQRRAEIMSELDAM
ncbi:MAG: PilZ domain-containing protein [Chloroflexota bacterium]